MKLSLGLGLGLGFEERLVEAAAMASAVITTNVIRPSLSLVAGKRERKKQKRCDSWV